VLTLLAGLLAATPARAASGAVSPQEGGVGTRFNFSADGFTPAERVDSWVTGPDGSVNPRYPSVYADAKGAIVWSWDVAPGTANGKWNMTARGITSDVRVVIDFIVTGSTPTSLPTSVSPASGAAGTTFSFRVGGLKPGERVGAWLTQPDGKSRDFDPGKEFRAYADESGAVNWSWVAPANAPVGDWLANARGLDSNREVSFGFTISGPPPTGPVRSVTPTSGAPGTTFTVVVGGFKASERVGSWLNQPDGSRLEATPYIVADDKGVATWAWQAPANAPSGVWQAVTHGRDGGLEVVLTFTVTGANPAPAGPNTPTITVSPVTAHPGDTLTISVSGFQGREDLNYWLTKPDGLPIENRLVATANGEGSSSFTYNVPNNAIAGNWLMNVVGDSSGRSAQAPFTVTIASTTPPYSVTPTSGPVGTTFHFTASGFRDKPEKVFFWFINPSGKGVNGPEWKRNNADGTVSWDWTVPSDAVGGDWKAVAHGEKSGVERVIPFSITRDTPPATASASVSPESGGPGTTFTFTADGYKEGERVGYWLNLPDGTVLRFDHELTGDSKGRVVWSWTAPANAPRGAYTMAARSSQSDKFDNDVAYEIRFTVQ
jgi:hypothetical protein